MKNVLITGGNDGIGRATALLLAGRECELLLVGRNQQRGAATERAIVAAGGSATFLQVDLSTSRGLREAAAAVQRRVTGLDAIVHAAGGVFSKHKVLTEDGIERTFAIQTLARFGLTELLLAVLRGAPGAKVVAISGGGSYGGGLDLSDLQGERTHSYFGSMAKHAVANDLLTAEQMARHDDIAFFNYGPGLVRTKVTMWHPVMRVVLGSFGRLFSRSPEEAAVDVVRLVSEDHDPGFYGPDLKYRGRTPALDDAGLSATLWDYCEELLSGMQQQT